MKTDLLILESDKIAAIKRIDEIEAEILSLGPEFREAFTQTSETWHDNAPFEIVRDYQTLLATERHTLKQVLNSSMPSVPKQPKNKVSIGKIVEVENLKNQKTTKYFIAGDWTSRLGEKINGAIVVSRRAPIATVMLDKKINDTFIFNNINMKINSIDEFIA